MIALSDEQLKIVQELARPIQRWQRDVFAGANCLLLSE